MEAINSLFTQALPNIFIFGFFGAFIWLFWKENCNNKSPVAWIDMLLDSKTNKVSMTKVFQLIASVIMSWVVITYTIRNAITYDLLAVYGTFVLGGYSVKTFLDKKKDPETPQ